MELYIGVRDKRELKFTQKFLERYEVIHINEAISSKAVELVRDYSLSHGCKFPDALIAATALLTGYELFTYNVKDFRYIPDIKLYDFAA